MKIAILGAGFMGKKHKAVLETFNEVEIIAEIDHNGGNSENYFPSLKEFLEKKINCDLVVVATPNNLHYPQTKILLQNGYNVLVEKPFCFSLKQAQDIQNAKNESGKEVFLVMQNRFSNVSQFLKQTIDNNALGKIYNIQFNAFWNRGSQYYTQDSWKGKKNLDGGILYTQFSHLIDLLCYLFADSFEVLFKSFDTFRNFEIAEIEDTALVVLQGKDGTKVIINFTTAVFEKNQETSLNIIAEKGTLKISGQYFNEVEFQHIADIPNKIEIPTSSNEDNLKEMYAEIFSALKGQKNTAIQLNDGICLVDLLDRIYQ